MSRPSDSQPTIKQQREQNRAAKVAALKQKQAAAKRNRTIGITLAVVAAVAVLALVVTFVVVLPSLAPKPAPDPVASGDPAAIEIAGLETFDGLVGTHVEGPVEYAMTPPAGGEHAAAWLNCGVYSEPQPNENAVHALEHGAVWVTYDPEQVDADGLATLRAALPGSYVILSPFPGLDAPVVASAWGAQVALDGVDDPRLELFLQRYWQSASSPEPGAPCTGALDGPGRVA